ncbi:Putative disease resistance protein At4g11170 [Linum perenne]
MASSSSPPPYTGKWEYDVFLCFRGDVRNNFMTHVKQAMLDQKIRVFVDTMLQKTEDVGELLEILKRTAVSVVIFSEKFADSSWCLDEVNTIVQSIEEFNHKTLPVFYNVDWTTVAGDEFSWFHDFKAALSCCFLPHDTPVNRASGPPEPHFTNPSPARGLDRVARSPVNAGPGRARVPGF